MPPAVHRPATLPAVLVAGGDPEFLELLDLEDCGDGRYRGTVSPKWGAPIQPQGGVTTAVALHAAALALDVPDQHLRSSYTLFAGQVPPGPAEVEVRVLRRGKGASQVQATLRPLDGDPAGHVVLATFALSRPAAIGYLEARPPSAPPPHECVDRWAEEAPLHPELVGPRPPFFGHFESRFVTGHLPWDGPWEPDTSEVVSWMRWNDPPVHADGSLSSLALIPPCDTMPGAVFERHGPDDTWYLVPSVDLNVQIYDTDLGPDGWLLRRNTSRWAGEGLAAADMELYSADGRLLAFATQLMHVRPSDVAVVRERIEANGGS